MDNRENESLRRTLESCCVTFDDYIATLPHSRHFQWIMCFFQVPSAPPSLFNCLFLRQLSVSAFFSFPFYLSLNSLLRLFNRCSRLRNSRFGVNSLILFFVFLLLKNSVLKKPRYRSGGIEGEVCYRKGNVSSPLSLLFPFLSICIF